MELFHAHNQWATRPADERFRTIKELYDVCKEYARSAGEKTVPVASIRTEAIDGNVQLVGRENHPALLTHWAFGQLSARIGAPASYLRELPATLACQNLNYGLARYADKTDSANLLFHQNDGLLLRAFTSSEYARIWNWEVAERLLSLESQGWSPLDPINVLTVEIPQCVKCATAPAGYTRMARETVFPLTVRRARVPGKRFQRCTHPIMICSRSFGTIQPSFASLVIQTVCNVA